MLRLNPRLAPYLVGYRPHPVEQRYDLDKMTYHEIAKQLLESQIKVMVLSHEKSGEQKTLAQRYGLPIDKTKDFGASDDIAEWNHLLRGDYTRPHPFKPDELLPDGTYRLGCPELFYIVADDQLTAPRDDAGLKTHRESVLGWEYTKEKLTEQGLSEAKPLKYKSDTCDSERMLHALGWGYAAPLTREERIERRVPEELRAPVVLAKRGTPEFIEAYYARQHALVQARKTEEHDERAESEAWGRLGGGRVAGYRRFRKDRPLSLRLALCCTGHAARRSRG